MNAKQTSMLKYGLTIATLMCFATAPLQIWAQLDGSPAESEVEELPLPAPAVALDMIDERPLAATPQDPMEYQVLQKGPLHEAYAAPLGENPADSKRFLTEPPPPPVDEQAPAIQDPTGENIWIPGYWAWSDDANQYVWVSGTYRRPPPGRSWTPGYWSQSDSGYFWSSGYWAGQQTASNPPLNLPPPPELIDNGPSVPPPGEDYFWLPGHWEYAGDHYRWRSGFWTRYYQDWVWQPACYVGTPQGYAFVDGYWDLLPTQRGRLYAPVSFQNSPFLQSNFVYRPRYRVGNVAALLLHLFVRPGSPHYYYGDYYGPTYAANGYLPWYDGSRGSRSPWVRYYDWNYRRSGIDFVDSLQRYDRYYRAAALDPKKLNKQGPKLDFERMSAQVGRGSPNDFLPRSFDDFVYREVAGKSPKRIDSKSSTRYSDFGSNSAQQFKSNAGNSLNPPKLKNLSDENRGRSAGSSAAFPPANRGSGSKKSEGQGEPRNNSKASREYSQNAGPSFSPAENGNGKSSSKSSRGGGGNKGQSKGGKGK